MSLPPRLPPLLPLPPPMALQVHSGLHSMAEHMHDAAAAVAERARSAVRGGHTHGPACQATDQAAAMEHTADAVNDAAESIIESASITAAGAWVPRGFGWVLLRGISCQTTGGSWGAACDEWDDRRSYGRVNAHSLSRPHPPVNSSSSTTTTSSSSSKEQTHQLFLNKQSTSGMCA